MSARLVRALHIGYVAIQNESSGQVIVYYPGVNSGMDHRVIGSREVVILSNEISVDRIRRSSNLDSLLNQGVLSIIDKPVEKPLTPPLPQLVPVTATQPPVIAPIPSTDPNDRPIVINADNPTIRGEQREQPRERDQQSVQAKKR